MKDLESLAGNVIVCGFHGLSAPESVRAWLGNDLVAGLILFKRNISDVQQTIDLIASCKNASDSADPILVCVDQEGGRVARLGAPVIQLPPMQTLAGFGDSALTHDAGFALGQQLRAIGFNLDFAPVLDVDTNPANPIIGDRAFGRSPEAVIEHALAFADGLRAGGILSCGKHFPGHGDTHQDSHDELPSLPHDLSRLNRVELPPFRAAVDRVDSVMTAHILFEALDPEVPATMSQAALGELLRRDVGFEGPVFSDDLEMDAVADDYEIHEAGVLAIEAGCDLLLVCSDLEAAAKLREALATEAEKSARFADRLRDARSRADALRRRVLDLPSPVSLQNALESPQARAVRQRLGHLE